MDHKTTSKKRKKAGSSKSSGIAAVAGRPFVSVVMPVRNEADFIKRSLGSALSQDYPHELLEIVIADGESTDSTVELINKLPLCTDISIKIVQNPKKIAPTALNLAIAEARGEIIVRIDGHCEIDHDYVSNCVKHLIAGSADGVGGPIETIGSGTHSEAISLAMSSKFGVGGSAFRTVNDRKMFTDTVAFPGYTREIIDRVGQFDEELERNQDDEYNFRIRKYGGKILLAPDIRSKYYSRSTFSSLWRQYFQYGYWKVRVLQLHPAQMSIRQFVPFFFVLSIAVLCVLALFFEAGRRLLIAEVVLYLIANLAASLVVGRRRIKLVPYLSLSFCILHISYAMGSIAGLFAFRNRWRESNNPTVADTQT